MAEKYGKHQVAESPEIAEARDNSEETRRGMSLLAKLALTVTVVTALIICVVSVMNDNRNREEIDSLKMQLEAYNEKMAEIQYWINQEVDDEYIEKFAKEKGWDFADAKEYLTGK